MITLRNTNEKTTNQRYKQAKKQAINKCNALKSERKNKRNVNFNQFK